MTFHIHSDIVSKNPCIQTMNLNNAVWQQVARGNTLLISYIPSTKSNCSLCSCCPIWGTLLLTAECIQSSVANFQWKEHQQWLPQVMYSPSPSTNSEGLGAVLILWTTTRKQSGSVHTR